MLLLFVAFSYFFLLTAGTEAAVTCYRCDYRTPPWSTTPCDEVNGYQTRFPPCILQPGQICDATQGCITPAPSPEGNCFYCSSSSYNTSSKSCTNDTEIPSVCSLKPGQVCDPTKGCISQQELQCSTTSCVTNSDCCNNYMCQNGACIINSNTGTGSNTGSSLSPGSLGSGTAGCGNGANQVWTLDCIFPLIQKIIGWALTFAGVLALILIIYSGIRFITSGGEQKSAESAKKILTYAIAGLVLVLLSFAIMNLISYITGVACINPSNPLSFTSCQ